MNATQNKQREAQELLKKRLLGQIEKMRREGLSDLHIARHVGVSTKELRTIERLLHDEFN